MRGAIKLALCAAAGLFMPGPLAAQDADPASDAADALYCAERKLGYWFYCVKPAPIEEPQQPEAEQVAATQELDAITPPSFANSRRARSSIRPRPM